MRFDDRLSIMFELDPVAKEAMVPVFLLQPLVENAIKHGLRCIKGVGRISICGVRDGERLTLTHAALDCHVAAAGAGIGTFSSHRKQGLRRYFGRCDYCRRNPISTVISYSI
jgi:LytS/YehU family sensor histidine kinase